MTTNIDRPSGFQVWNNLIRTNLYAVNTAPVINVFHNDVVIAGEAFISTPHGYMMYIRDSAVPDGVAGILGAVLAVFDEKMDPVPYIAATEVGNGTIAGYVLVADSPDQLFIAQEDCTTAAIDLADGAQNANIVSTTLCAGNTTTGISKQEIASDTVLETAALQVKLVHPHQADLPAVDTDVGCRYIVQLNEHYFGDTIVGIA